MYDAPPRRRIAVAVAASVLGLAGVAALVAWAAVAAEADRDRRAASPSPTPYSVPMETTSAEPATGEVVEKLPAKLCGLIDRSVVPAELRDQEPGQMTLDDGEQQHCVWQYYKPDGARYFSLSIEAIHSDDTKLSVIDASEEFTRDKDDANPLPVDGVGDEAFGTKASNIIETDGKKYAIEGAHVAVRTRNVLVQAYWEGADYPEQHNVPMLRGENLTYEEALPVAVKLAESAIDQLN
ncbi:hypothetical protein [Flindersiella endophytica]